MSDINKNEDSEILSVGMGIMKCVSNIPFEDAITHLTSSLLTLLQIGVTEGAFTYETALDILGKIGDDKEQLMAINFSELTTKH